MGHEKYERIRALLRKHTEEMKGSPQKARDWFVHLGTHNPDGTLTKKYGGAYTTGKHVGTERFEIEYIFLESSMIHFRGHPHRLLIRNWHSTGQIQRVRDWCYDFASGRYHWVSLSEVDFAQEADAFACMVRWRGEEIGER